MAKIKVGIIGSDGMLGSDLLNKLGNKFNVVGINKDTYTDYKGQFFDIIINANGNSKRYWAIQNVLEDFSKSTISVYNSIFDFKFSKYIYISSSDVYSNPSDKLKTRESSIIISNELNTYGFHKFLSELIVRNNCKDWIILRSSLILGQNLKKGPFFDIINKKALYISKQSKLQIINTSKISDIIKTIVTRDYKNKIFNIGGEGVFDFRRSSVYFVQKPVYSNKTIAQHYEMNVSLAKKIFKLKSSEDYLKEWIDEQKI